MIGRKETAGVLDEATYTLEAVDGLILTLQKFRAMASLVDQTGAVILEALQKGNKVLTCGNGGSAADALHMSEELLGRYKRERVPLPSICLSADPTLLTCIGNDYGFDALFSRQVEGLGAPGDILVIFSSSGNSMNQIKALAAAERRGVTSIALLGKDGGKMAGQADHEIIIPANETARVQEVHTLILHSWLERIDLAFAETS
jgi:phosphoheptose isomerase